MYGFDPEDNLTYKLMEFLKNNPGYNMITTNRVVSNLSPEQLNNYLYLIMTRNDTFIYLFGVCYISKWLDQCLTYGNQSQLANTGASLVRTRGPRGFNTVLISPQGANTIIQHLNEADGTSLNINEYILRDIQANKLTAVSFTDSLIGYDPLKAMNNSDYIRTTECENPQPVINDNPSNLYMMYFILVVVLILVLAYLLFKIAPFINSSIDDYRFFDNPLAVYN